MRQSPNVLRFAFASVCLAGPACSAVDASSRAPVASSVAGIHAVSAAAGVDVVQPKLEQALSAEGFGVLFRADMGRSLAKFADEWGDDYNRSGLDAIRSVLFCNPKYANQAANEDPFVLALCPLHITLLEKDGATTLLFARPTAIAGETKAAATVELVEGKVLAAMENASAKHP